MEDREEYGIRAAARRVAKSRRTIYRWMRDGMPYKTVAGRRWIAHDDLLAMWRGRIISHRTNRSAHHQGRFSRPV